MRSATRTAAAIVALALGGCSLWNAPDRARLDGGPLDAPPLDAAPDAPDDALDGGPDAPDAGPPRVEPNCSDGMDDDGDGFVDCADLDCAADLVNCCMSDATPALSQDWTSFTGWARLPSGADGPNEATPTQPLSRFTTTGSEFARALIHDPPGTATGCVAIDPGVRIETTLRLVSAGPCATADCTERAGILLTGVQPATAVASYTNGDTLPDELGVRLRPTTGGMGLVEVTLAGVVEATWMNAPDVTITVEIQLVPGVSPEGRPVSITTVRLSRSGDGMTMVALDRVPAIERSHLLGPEAGCGEGNGLYLAVEGVGNRVGVGTLRIWPQVCPNPNYFRTPLDPLSAADLGASAAFSSGGVGAPSLHYADEDTTGTVAPRWDVLFDASNRNRANETLATVRFAVGGAVFHDEGWTVMEPRRLGAPLVDEAFPVCGTGCVESNRDPDFWLDTDAEREIAGAPPTAIVVWSHQRADGEWEIVREYLRLTIDQRLPSPPEILLTTADAGPGTVVAECTALRSPSLVERPDGGFWLFFACEQRGTAAGGDVRVALLDAAAVLQTPPGAPVLTGALVPYARNGIQDLDAEAWIRNPGTADQEVLLRLWFVSRSGGLPVVGLAEGVSRGLAGGSAPPALMMFPGNPVLLSDAAPMPACTGLCRMTSVSAARAADERNVRLLVAFTDEGTGAPLHLLVPLEQTLPAR